MLCEMCSTKQAAYKADVEGARVSVCEPCSKYGKVLGKVQVQAPAGKASSFQAASAVKQTESVQLIKPDYARIVKAGRERLGLKQEELARKMMEKESLLHKVENGHLKPDIELARKLERFLKVSLVEQMELEVGSGSGGPAKKAQGMTIGDMITKK